MIVSMKEMLIDARKNEYAVAAPNVFTSLEIHSALHIAEKKRAPIILNFLYDHTIDFWDLSQMAIQMAQKSCIPVAINLDHGKYRKDYTREVEEAIELGFTSVMVDASLLPYSENVEIVKEVVNIAHKKCVTVEAEIGHVGTGEFIDSEIDNHMTDPYICKEFVDDTNIDCVAIAIGTVHGSYGQHVPRIDFERLKQIRRLVDVPLVLHGSSGTGEENLRRACRLGINKVNVCVDLLYGAYNGLMKSDLSGNNIYKLWETISEGWAGKLEESICIFGSENKANIYTNISGK